MEKAELYVGTKIYIEADENDAEDEYEDLKLEGYTVIDATTRKEIGVIQDVIAYSMNIVLDVKKSEGDSVLLPLADELVKECDETGKKLVLTIAEGLLEE